MKKIIASIWFLALIIAVPVIFFLPDMFSKYKVVLLFQESTDQNINHIHFEDLNGDGRREKVTSHKNSSNKLAVQIHAKGGAVANQQNFNYNYFNRTDNIYFGDINNDKLLEIYGFTINGDSLYLTWFNPITDYVTQESRLILKIDNFDKDKTDISILHFEVIDLERDGINEILISIEAGYSIHPRILILYKPNEDKTIQSVDWGINSYFPFLSDLNNDGISEIIASGAASDNLFTATGVPNIDDRPWLQVYNSELEHFFDPVSFSAGLSNTTQTFVTNDGKNDLIVFNCNRSRDVNEMIQLYKFDRNGNTKDSTYLQEHGKNFTFEVFQINTGFLFFTGTEVLWINNDLKVTKNIKITPSAAIEAIDTISKLNQTYFIAITQNRNRLNIFTEDFTEVVVLRFEDEKIASLKTKTSYGEDSFFVRTESTEYYYKLDRNRNYYLKYPIYFFIYLLSVFFIWFVQMIREKQLREKFELQSKVRELQLQSLNNQLDPHFIFNTFNTIASVVKQGKNDDAYFLMLRFSKLVRQNMEGSGDISTTLKKEIDFTEDYLSIQKFRFKTLFEYHISVGKYVNTSIRIPKLVIQIHVENALKHGIRPSNKNGLLTIQVKQEASEIKIKIEDNGIGRENAKKLKTGGTGIGLKAIQQIIDVHNKSSKNKISQEIIDLFDASGNSIGTQIVLKIMFS